MNGAGAHLMCALPAVTHGSELFGPLLMTEPLDFRDGGPASAGGSGLGLDLDEDRVARYTRP
jgi:muconate cycloisomerase